MFKRLFTACLIFGTAALAPPVQAQPITNCAPRTLLVERLSDAFGENQIALGLQSPTVMVELWGSEQSGTFTILLTRPDSISCVVSSGSGLVVLPRQVPHIESRF
ncbi:hypothetical protein [Albibacillus kandeliae]|uniref:hypothetical protein n=1 Tax=Albibacillus kandeliae TaxID=2174228 RepID=UPI000D695FD9|nr:hypothetical protein [Albibacillus kandeliae]